MSKKALITGITGQDGSYLAELLLNKNYIVHGIKRKSSSFNTQRIDHIYIDRHLSKNFFLHYGDLADSNSIFNIINKVKPDEIYNLACPASPVHYQYDPVQTTKTSVHGAINMLGLAKRLKAKIMQASTSEVYGSALFVPITEDHPLQGQSPYSASKISADQMALSYHSSFETPVCILRPFNTYGPRHTYDVIPKFIKMAINNDSITIHGDGKQSRDLTYISDAVTAFLLVAEKKQCCVCTSLSVA